MKALSLMDIERIAITILQDYGHRREDLKETPIEDFAINYMGLKVRYEKLSNDGSVQGLTAYMDTAYVYEEKSSIRIIPVARKEIVLDSSYTEKEDDVLLNKRKRFTLAHEIAHQIIYDFNFQEGIIIDTANNLSLRKKILTTQIDWNEWQANALGAALLMPKNKIDLIMFRLNNCNQLTNYEGRFNNGDYKVIKSIMDCFNVSMSVAVIRLKQTGYIIEKSWLEFHERWEIIYEELQSDAG